MHLLVASLQVETHMDIQHSPKLIDLIPKFWEIPDQIDKIINLTFTHLGIHRVHNPTMVAILREMLLEKGNHLDNIGTINTRIIIILLTEISRGVPSHMHDLMKDITRGTDPLHTHPPHH